MRIAFDTNLLVAALTKPSGASGRIVRAWRDGRVEFVASEATLAEADAVVGGGWLERVVPRDAIASLLVELRERAVMVNAASGRGRPAGSPYERIAGLGLKDAGDVRMVEAAVAGGARYVVTTDREFLSKRGLGDVEFVTPSEFLRVLEADRPDIAEL